MKGVKMKQFSSEECGKLDFGLKQIREAVSWLGRRFEEVIACAPGERKWDAPRKLVLLFRLCKTIYFHLPELPCLRPPDLPAS